MVIERGKKPKSRLIGRLRKNRFLGEQREVCGASYYHIQTATDNIPWERIRPIAGRNVQFLVEKGVDVPEGIPLFQGEKLAERLLEREFTKHLRRLRPKKLTVVDYDGDQLNKMERYFRYAAQIRVITGRVEQYTDCSIRLLRHTGATLLISRDIKAAADSQMLYAPKGVRGQFLAPTGMQVFTLHAGEVRGGHICYPRSVSCTKALEVALPNGVSPMLFLSALYELSGFQQLDQIKLDIGLYI